ncbi:MAG: aminotransferase class V-fold PLP-dependent enzyme [Planctomycetia bacterium]|nr:aminotransferase class V-fold PLP-dependent enzyme [Planctomycetia bacterium]
MIVRRCSLREQRHLLNAMADRYATSRGEIMTMDLFERYGLTRVINACGKMTHLAGAIVLPEIAAAASESLNHFFVLDELQAAAGRIIAETTGAESGCVTACTAAGITLGVAACMTGTDIAKVLQLPDVTGMPHRVLIQKGHCINYGNPVTQAIRLAGATVVEVGVVNRCTPEELRHELRKGDVAAVVHVESHHTVRSGWVSLPVVAELAGEYKVPVIVDGAAQDQRFHELINAGAALVLASAHKYLCSTTAGIVAGRKDLIDAVYLQNRGIGRPMKAGKEAIVGAMAALQYRARQDMTAWTAEQDRKVALILERLEDIPQLQLSVDPDPNGCPFSRVRLTLATSVGPHSAIALRDALAAGDPTIVLRAHHLDEGYVNIDAIEMTDDEIELVCQRIREFFAA